MKKIIGLLIIAILILSAVPFALADKGDGNGPGAKDCQIDGDCPLKEGKGLNFEEDCPPEGEYEKKGFMYAGEKLEIVKSQYAEAKEQFKLGQDELKEWRHKLQECKGEGNCDEVIKEHKKSAVGYLGTLIDKTSSALENLEERILETESESKEALLERISVAKEEVSVIDEKVNALGEEPSKEEVRALAKELKEVMNSVKPKLKVAAGMAVHAKLGNIVEKSEGLANNLENQISSMEGDTTIMEDLLERFRGSVAEAKETHKLSVESFVAAMDTSGNEEKLSKLGEAREYQKQTKAHLEEARSYLKELVPMIKGEDTNGVETLGEE